jgi:hypothetical protein
VFCCAYRIDQKDNIIECVVQMYLYKTREDPNEQSEHLWSNILIQFLVHRIKMRLLSKNHRLRRTIVPHSIQLFIVSFLPLPNFTSLCSALFKPYTRRRIVIPLTGLILSHVCACPKPGLGLLPVLLILAELLTITVYAVFS